MSEESTQKDILFSDFGKVLLKIIIGLASFQLLAPIIWNYLSDLLHLKKLFSLNVIILIYFILPIVLVLLWWKDSRKKFIALSRPPVTDNNPGNIQERIQKALIGFIHGGDFILLLLLIANVLLLLFPVEPSWVIYMLQFTYLAALVILVIASHRITESYFLGLDDFSSVLKSQRTRYILFRLTFYSLFALIIVMQLQYLFGKDYMSKDNQRICDTNTIQSRTELQNAFRMVDVKSSLSGTREKLEAGLQELHQLQKLQQVHRLQYHEMPVEHNELTRLASFKNSFSASGNILPAGGDSVLSTNFYQTFFRLAVLSNFVDSANALLYHKPDDIQIAEPPYDFETMLGLQDLPPVKDSLTSPSMKVLWYEASVGIMKNIEQSVDKTSRKMVSKILSNLQMKGVFSFLTLMIFLMCLYLFLKINGEILSIISSEPVKKGNRESEVLKKYSDENLDTNKKLTENVWLYMTIMLGLLIPLLKPVSPEKLNLDKPFQALTLPGQIKSEYQTTIDNHSSTQTIDSSTTYVININSDRETASLPASNSGLDEGTYAMIKAVYERVNNMSTSKDDKKIRDDVINSVKSIVVAPAAETKTVPKSSKKPK